MNPLEWMTPDAALISPAIVRVAAWTLLHFVWQGALVGGVLATALTLLRRQDARLRYTIALAALATMAMMPVVTATMIASRSDSMLQTITTPWTADSRGTATVAPAAASALSTDNTSDTAQPSIPPAARQSNLESALPWLVIAWLIGVAALSLAHCGGWRRVRRLREQGVHRIEDHWQELCQSLAIHLGIRRTVRLLESAQVGVPTVIGWLRPIILVPTSALTGLSQQQLESILAHELAHVRRHDVLINTLQVAVETLLFYHPAVWWASQQVRTLREHCCDDLAVEACGDRMTYARALAELEDLRFAAPAFALGADGAPLLQRIRRLVGASEELRPPTWLTGALAVSALATTAIIFAFAGQPGIAQEAIHDTPVGSPHSVPAMLLAQLPDPARPSSADDWSSPGPRSTGASHADEDIVGRWMSESKKSRPGKPQDMVWMQLKTPSQGRHHSTMSTTFVAAELIGLTTGKDVRFQLRRPAGTLTFTGDVDASGLGSGTFNFEQNPDFQRQMKDLGYNQLSTQKAFELALFNVDPELVRELADLGYDDIPLERLIELCIHDVDPDFIRQLASAGYPDLALQRLVEMRIHGVSPDYIVQLVALGYTDLPASQLVEMRIHGINPDSVRELNELLGRKLSAQRLVEMRIHGVSHEAVGELKALGYRDLSPERLIEMRIHGVTPSFIREMAELGYRDLPGDRLVEMRIHGVGPAFVKELEEHGYTDVPAAKLVEMRIHGIDARFLQRVSHRTEND